MKKKNFLFFFFLIVFCMIPGWASADRIDSIAIEAELLPNGDLYVKEVWEAEAEDGTEFFIPIQALNHMQIEDFKVSDEEGPYQALEPWDIRGSLADKARKYGIHDLGSEGLELCWGKTSLGPHTYTLEFVYKNALIAFQDYDAFNIRFVNDQMDPAPRRATLTLSAKEGTLSPENARIWAFGYRGDINFVDGQVKAQSDDTFNASNYMNIMLAVNKGLFQPTYSQDEDFEKTMKKRALDGASWNGISADELEQGQGGTVVDGGGDYVEEEDDYYYGNEDDAWPEVAFTIFFALLFSLVGWKAVKDSRPLKNYKKINKSKPDYWRDPPFEGYMPAIAYIYANESDDELENYMSAQMLDLVKQGQVDIEQVKNTGGLSKLFNPEDTFLVVQGPLEAEKDYEETLVDWLTQAQDKYGKEGRMEDKDFRRYLSKNARFPYDYEDEMKEYGQDYLLKHGYAVREKRKHISLTPEGLEEASKVFAYVRFMDEFTLLNEREPYEVALWDQLLIMATLLGVGDKVYAAFKEVYPDYAFQSRSGTYFNYYYLNSFSKSSYRAAMQAAQAAEAGLGGAASIGGGGGFSGGGSGGGGR